MTWSVTSMSFTRFDDVVAVRRSCLIPHTGEDVELCGANRLICVVITQRELQMIGCLTSRLPLAS
jgi:hypothetical protein